MTDIDVRYIDVGVKGDTGPAGQDGQDGEGVIASTRVYVFAGESNLVVKPAYNSTPPANAWMWNADNGSDQTNGSAFAPLANNVIGGNDAFLAQMARLEPLVNHYGITVAKGGIAFAPWIGGYLFTFSSDTNDAVDPGIGVVKLSSDNSEIIFSHYEARGNNRIGQIQWLLTGTKVKVTSVADPTAWFEFTTSIDYTAGDGAGSLVNFGAWGKFTGTITAAGNVVPPGPVKYEYGTNMWQRLTTIVPLALAALNVTKIDEFHWWHGANDALPYEVQGSPDYFKKHYLDDFEVFHPQLKAQSWFPERTPIYLWGMASSITGGFDSFRIQNGNLQRIVKKDPETRHFLYHNLENGPDPDGPFYWQELLINQQFAFHTTGLGAYLYGTGNANAVFYGTGRNLPAGATADPENGSIYVERGSIHVGDEILFPPKISVCVPGTDGGRIQIQSENVADFRTIRFSDDILGGTVSIGSARGTIAAPAVVHTGDVAQLFFMFFDGVIHRVSAEMRAVVKTATPSTTDMETSLSLFAVGPASVTQSEIARFSVSAGLQMYGVNSVINSSRHFQNRLYTIATLPLSFSPAGQTAYAIDLFGSFGGQVQTNGTHWVKTNDPSSVVV